MRAKNLNLAKDLFDIVGFIPAAKRLEAEGQIRRLQAAIGSTDDLFVDRRAAAWAPGGKARTTIDARVKTTKPPKPESLNYEVTWRGAGSIICTAEKAAEIVKKSRSTLAVYISRGKGVYNTRIDDDIITVRRIPLSLQT